MERAVTAWIGLGAFGVVLLLVEQATLIWYREAESAWATRVPSRKSILRAAEPTWLTQQRVQYEVAHQIARAGLWLIGAGLAGTIASIAMRVA